MYELRITVSKVLGRCTADPPMKKGDYFVVRDGDISIPEGGYVCMWALQSVMPVITPKEREIGEARDEDWMWRVHHVQCPDPRGRVVFKIEQVRKLDRRHRAAAGTGAVPAQGSSARQRGHPHGVDAAAGAAQPEPENGAPREVQDLRVVVEQVGGSCTSGMKPGDHFVLRGGRLYIPAGRHFCLYALHATLPLLPAKQRRLEDQDWLARDSRVICPDPAGNVIVRIGPDRKTEGPGVRVLHSPGGQQDPSRGNGSETTG